VIQAEKEMPAFVSCDGEAIVLDEILSDATIKVLDDCYVLTGNLPVNN